MKLTFNCRKFLLTAVILLCGASSGAQTYVRYVNPEDLSSKIVYADSVLTSITLPQGVSRLADYPKFNAAAYELSQVLKDSSKELMQVWVCGSASPDGLWGYNHKLAQARADAAAAYLREVLNVPDSMIHKENLDEDWDHLYELVEASDIICKSQVLEIIRTKSWGARKTALQKLMNGQVWKILETDFFPQLRCVRFAIYCKWDQTKPYLSRLEPQVLRDTVVLTETVHLKDTLLLTETVHLRDTIYVRDTVVVEKIVTLQPDPQPVTREQVYEEYREENLKKKGRDIDWLDQPVMAVKTNLVSDALAIPSLGLEFQLAKWLSLDVQGFYGFYNMLNPANRDMTAYGVSPELRFWIRKNAVQKGSFIGLHGNCAVYSLTWRDGINYSNDPQNPAWSAGITYGYTACLDRKAHWGLEFYIGAGYGRYQQLQAQKEHFGITKLGINLVYRFSVAGNK